MRDLGASGRPVYYVHGCVERPDDPEARNLVLAASDFERAYNECLNGFINEVLMNYKVAFFGCRLREQTIGDVFQRVDRVMKQLESTRRSRPLPRRLVFLGETDTDAGGSADEQEQGQKSGQSEIERIEELGIRVLRYPDAQEHFLLDKILSNAIELRSASSAPLREVGNPTP